MKLVRERLNEGLFSCNIDDLYKAVVNKIKSDISSNMKNITIDKEQDEIKITYKYTIVYNNIWNLSDQQIQDKVIERTNQFKSHFLEFKDFCDKGVRGVVSPFKKETKMINIHAYGDLEKIKYGKPRKVLRYSTMGIDDLGNETSYIERNGKDKLDELTIVLSLFLVNI